MVDEELTDLNFSNKYAVFARQPCNAIVCRTHAALIIFNSSCWRRVRMANCSFPQKMYQLHKLVTVIFQNCHRILNNSRIFPSTAWWKMFTGYTGWTATGSSSLSLFQLFLERGLLWIFKFIDTLRTRSKHTHKWLSLAQKILLWKLSLLGLVNK